MNPNSTPPEGLRARESASEPEKAPGVAGAVSEAQAGVQRLQPSESELHARQAHTEESYWRRPKPATQTSAKEPAAPAPDPRAVLLDAISTALNAAGYWLPIDGKKAVADAVLKAGNDETEKWRRKAISRAVALGRAEHAINAIRDLAGETVTEAHAWGDGYREALRDLNEILEAFAPKDQP